MITCPAKCGIKLLIYSQNSTVQPLKFGDPSMDKWSHAQQSTGWSYLSIPKLQRCNRWSLGMEKQFHLTFYNGGNYISMLGLKSTDYSMLVKGATAEFTHDLYALSYQISVKISIKASKPRDMDLKLSDYSEIWQASCWYHGDTCQISERQNDVNTQYRSLRFREISA